MTCEGQQNYALSRHSYTRAGRRLLYGFVDIPEALTQGETVTVAEAMEAAKDALLTAFDFYFEDNELIPLPSPLNSHDHFIEVPLSVASKVLLLNVFYSS